MKSNTIFITTASEVEEPAVRLLIDSLRAFGGELANNPVWVFTAHPQEMRRLEYAPENDPTRILPLVVPAPVSAYPFGRKVAACAQAEQLVPAGTRTLVWIDPSCLIVQPPVLFDLGEGFDAAFRPVHIRNVGLPSAEPLDAFWQGIYTALGLKDISTTVTSFVDNQRLRTYFNTHAFALNPSLGLMRRWYELFQQLIVDEQFQIAVCQDELHQIFLFQALLSALVASSLEPARVRMLPTNYNYPYNLQGRLPAARRAAALDDLVCFTYEDRSIHPNAVADIQIREPLRAWLEARVPGDKI
jgi:hypothetical protein